jgi:hypothetical protein
VGRPTPSEASVLFLCRPKSSENLGISTSVHRRLDVDRSSTISCLHPILVLPREFLQSRFHGSQRSGSLGTSPTCLLDRGLDSPLLRVLPNAIGSLQCRLPLFHQRANTIRAGGSILAQSTQELIFQR